LIRYHASWILPINQPPIRDGWIAVRGGRIVAVGRADRVPRDGREVDLGAVAVLPGLVNAHTHLELSYLRDEVPPADRFVDWIRHVMAARRTRADSQAAEIVRSVEEGIAEADAFGTAIVGDISNTLVTVPALVASRLAAIVFYELIGFKLADAELVVDDAQQRIGAIETNERVRIRLAAHAPYSVAPQLLVAMRGAAGMASSVPSSVHLSESVEEVDFIRTGGGAWRAVLEEVDSWNAAWEAPGVSPVQYLDDIGFLNSSVLAVHGVQMTRADLQRLEARGTTLVACPRSNRRTGAGTPPIAEFYASGVRVAVGTDSLASTPDLSVFAELAAMRALAPGVSASRLLASATRHGADALGFGADYGTISPGKRARLVAIRLADGADVDVEEYLVSGIERQQIHWIEE
jgi:cytosine/adenosine deaminase-related metal-dependent hydrolase